MLFNSIAFLVFFPVVVLLYFLLPYKYRWILLLIASYYFYMCWKVEYIILIFISTVVDYFVAIKMDECPVKKDKRKWLYLSLLVNLGFLFTFKYYNFVSSNINALVDKINLFAHVPVYDLLIPVGISFYTFQTLSYSIDVYNGKVKPERHFGLFALYVSFFPQLVAGPIERPSRLLPQFRQKFDFDYERIVDGLKMMAWGFFLKLVIADRVSPLVTEVFGSPESYHGSQVLLGTFLFSFQIFCDFAGYSIIAIGAAKVLGYDLMQNFRRPYFSPSIREFWKRWHISLSTWFQDYVYIPLGGNRVVKWRWYYNLFVTFLVSGLWHGANWTYVIWGALHGGYLIMEIVAGNALGKVTSKIPRVVKVLFTFCLATLAWIFFRAKSVGDAFALLGNIFESAKVKGQADFIKGFSNTDIGMMLFFIIALLAYQLVIELGRTDPLRSKSTVIRWVSYVVLIMVILGFGVFSSSEFIYFQF